MRVHMHRRVAAACIYNSEFGANNQLHACISSFQTAISKTLQNYAQPSSKLGNIRRIDGVKFAWSSYSTETTIKDKFIRA